MGFRELGFSTYAAYLESAHWRDFQNRYRVSRRPQNCLVCGNPNAELHHVTYARVGRELLDDVCPLCRDHHRAVHAWLDARKKPVACTCWAVSELAGRDYDFYPPGLEHFRTQFKREQRRARAAEIGRAKRQRKKDRAAAINAPTCFCGNRKKQNSPSCKACARTYYR